MSKAQQLTVAVCGNFCRHLTWPQHFSCVSCSDDSAVDWGDWFFTAARQLEEEGAQAEAQAAPPRALLLVLPDKVCEQSPQAGLQLPSAELW